MTLTEKPYRIWKPACTGKKNDGSWDVFNHVPAFTRIQLRGFTEPFAPDGPNVSGRWGFYFGIHVHPHYLSTHVTYSPWIYINGLGIFRTVLHRNPGGRAYTEAGAHFLWEDEDGHPTPEFRDPNPSEAPDTNLRELQKNWMRRLKTWDHWPQMAANLLTDDEGNPVYLTVSHIR